MTFLNNGTGLVRGGNTAWLELNSFLSFTENSIRWIDEVIHTTNKTEPEDMGVESFMARIRALQQAQ